MTAYRNYLLLASIFLLPSATALQCGQALTTPCLGATDIRYNAEASNDAIKQADGAFVCVLRSRQHAVNALSTHNIRYALCVYMLMH
jgi:hypothetical protein